MMKMGILLLFMVACLAHASEVTLDKHIMPKYYQKRAEPVVNIALIYYGDYYTPEDLLRVQNLFEKRFHLATDRALTVNTVFSQIIPFKNQLSDFPDYRQEYVTAPDRLQRLWYYDNVGAAVIKEVYDQVKADLKKIDYLLVVTGAQFDALGFASGRVGITENPMEIAWGLKDGGRVEFVSDERVVDELIHEMGHTMFLGHASSQCQKPGLSIEEKERCCEESPAKNDVMSYCRSRNKVDANFFYGFEACNLRTIKEKIIPALLKGGEWAVKNRESCT